MRQPNQQRPDGGAAAQTWGEAGGYVRGMQPRHDQDIRRTGQAAERVKGTQRRFQCHIRAHFPIVRLFLITRAALLRSAQLRGRLPLVSWLRLSGLA